MRFKLGFVLFLLGMAGVLSLLNMELPLDQLPEETFEVISPETLKWLILVNPTLMLIAAIVLGCLFYQKTQLRVPLITAFLERENTAAIFSDQLKVGLISGVIAGALILLVSAVFHPLLPASFIELGQKMAPHISVRLLYGGITEEILMRFGAMTFVVWLVSKMSVNPGNWVYWIGIVVAALLFALGHLPIVFQTADAVTPGLIAYILLGNSAAGLVFGWVYWKKGLEAAVFGHAFAHVVMIIGESLLQL